MPSGGSVSVAGWTKAVLEPEVAVHLGSDLPGGAGEDAAREAIGALGAAFELADIDFPPDDPEAILAANVYQRAVVLGPGERGRRRRRPGRRRGTGRPRRRRGRRARTTHRR